MPEHYKQMERVEPLEVRLEYHTPPSINPCFVSNMTIQLVDGGLFKISFYDPRSPLYLRDGEREAEEQKDIKDRQPVTAVCVASIVVHPEKLRTWLGLMTNAVDTILPPSKKPAKEKPKK